MWDGNIHSVLARKCFNNSHSHEDRHIYIYTYKGTYLLKIPLEFNIQILMPLHFSLGKGGAFRSEGCWSRPHDQYDAWWWSSNDHISEDLQGLREGDAGCSLLRARRAQKALLRTAVYRVMNWFALVISQFSSWPQYKSVIMEFLKNPVNGTIPLRLQFR